MSDQVQVVHAARPTMKDVASRAGVALKTVSRVVNGEPGVTPETTKRVLGAIADLGFRRNESARLLRTGRTATLGFIVDSWREGENAAVYHGIEIVVREHGYLLYAGSTDAEPELEERLALTMCARRVDGLIIIPTPGPHEYLRAEIQAGVGCVFVMRPPSLVRADVVLPDERGGARAAITHLIEHGHQRIGFLGPPAGHRSAELLAGCREALGSSGYSLVELDSAADLASADVTAVLCASQEMTREALRASADAAAPPAIVGFGDFDFADVVSPSVSVVAYDPVLIGRTAAELLVGRLTGDRTPPRRIEVPTRLIARLPR
jgi:LacI family transcriptional regulator